MRESMLPYLGECFGNPHSVNHVYGWDAADAVRLARGRVAECIGADDDEIVFTSGATESCNLALRGIARTISGQGCRIITTETEHPAVLETARDLAQDGFDVTILPVGPDGVLDLTALTRALHGEVALVSVMAANNEIGVLQRITRIADLCHEYGALFHTDATQAVGRIQVDVDAWDADLLSFSGHKLYGPKGIGALYVRSGTHIKPVSTGGGQESGLRPGTVPVPLVVGFGMACKIVSEEWEQDAKCMSGRTERLRASIQRVCPSARLFGDHRRRLPGSLSIGFPEMPADEVIDMVSDRIAISTGSACSSGMAEPSRVLLALGVEPEVAATGVRVSLGRFTNDDEIDFAISVLSDVAEVSNRRQCYA